MMAEVGRWCRGSHKSKAGFWEAGLSCLTLPLPPPQLVSCAGRREAQVSRAVPRSAALTVLAGDPSSFCRPPRVLP